MEVRKGAWFGIAAYAFWGLTPLFWNVLDDIDSTDLLLHRIVWAIPILALILMVQRRFTQLWRALSSARVVAVTVVGALLLLTNWSIWLWSVTNQHIIDASLGYFITPIVSVTLGILVLREQLRKLQWVSVGIAAVGVVGMTITVGTLPWIALVLASSFGLYGLVKKRADVPPPLISVSGEVLVMFLPALVVLLFVHEPVGARFTDSVPVAVYLILAGGVTIVPLLLFGAAAKRIPLTTLGLLQYIAPTLQLILGVWLFGESLSTGRFVWFVVVWIALVVYTYDSLKAQRTIPFSAQEASRS